MDARDPSAAQSRPFALWQRFERRGVVDPRVFAAAAREDRPTLGLADARMLNAIFYALRSGCPWRSLPEHFPRHQTTYRWFVRFRDDGLWESLNHQLVMLDRERVGREASPSAAVIDSQSVKTTERNSGSLLLIRRWA